MTESTNTTEINETSVVQSADAGESLFKEGWRRFKRNKLAMVGLVMTLTIIFAAVFANVRHRDNCFTHFFQKLMLEEKSSS